MSVRLNKNQIDKVSENWKGLSVKLAQNFCAFC